MKLWSPSPQSIINRLSSFRNVEIRLEILGDLLHYFGGGADGLVDVRGGVRGGDEAGFEL